MLFLIKWLIRAIAFKGYRVGVTGKFKKQGMSGDSFEAKLCTCTSNKEGGTGSKIFPVTSAHTLKCNIPQLSWIIMRYLWPRHNVCICQYSVDRFATSFFVFKVSIDPSSAFLK